MSNALTHIDNKPSSQPSLRASHCEDEGRRKLKQSPALRFKEFDGDIEETLFGSHYSFHTTNSLSRDKLNYDKGEVRNIHYGDIHTKFQTHFHLVNEYVPLINEDVDLAKIKEDSYCKVGDLVIADASEDYADIGKSIELIDINNEKLLAGLHTFLARPSSESTSVGYISCLLKSWKLRKQIMTIAQGTKVLSLSAGRVSNLKLNIPTLPEQQKIASFLSAVDNKIQQLTKKKALLEHYKKGVMQQLFSGQLRFKDENGEDYPDWEWVGGNELFDNISDKKHNSDLPILAITQDQGAIPRELINYQMTVTEASVASYKVVQKGDFIISLRTFQGGIEFSEYHGICSPAYNILRPSSDDVDRAFYKFYLKTSFYIRQLQKNLEGIRDGKMISYKYFSEIKVPFPSKPEQQKVATYVSRIDTKIESVNNQMTQTQTFKKGLLQQMFV
ncbi:restriction endonuclease subunit S [Patiriisocius sp. Uisw_047]|uniref:restriction endonuclease subunit S n=1 Tax=Patiriisocius sp. Uisw_047 TaxID=3230969 RepID=UPI0039EA0E82